jgi:hypothetical protein
LFGMFSEDIPANNRRDSVIYPSLRSTLRGHGLLYKYIGRTMR